MLLFVVNKDVYIIMIPPWEDVHVIFTVRCSDRQYCFRRSFYLCAHSWTAALSLMKFCRNMYLDNCSKPREF